MSSGQSHPSMAIPLRIIAMKLLLLLLYPQLVTSVLYVPAVNQSYSSLPALFGQSWPKDATVSAWLQMLEDRPFLCQDETTNAGCCHNLPIQPSDDLPVALLVERGSCTFFEKAKIASQWDIVDYVVVYDNVVSPNLVPMSSEYPSNMSLLFVSYNTGQGTILKLRVMFATQASNHFLVSSWFTTKSFSFLLPPHNSIVLLLLSFFLFFLFSNLDVTMIVVLIFL